MSSESITDIVNAIATIDKEIVLSVISLIGMAFFGGRKIINERNRAAQAETEMTLTRNALDFSSFFINWNSLLAEIDLLMRETCIDRFMILQAWNGSNSPRWTTAIYQYRQGHQKPVAYIHFDLDADYVNRLNLISQVDLVNVTVDHLPDCKIKRVYLAEGVKHSIWVHVDSSDHEQTGGKRIVYCSYSTHESDPIPQNVQTRCGIISNRLAGVIQELAA